MRAHTNIITTTNRSRLSARRCALVLGLAVCSLAVPATASAFTITGYLSDNASNSAGYSSVNAISGPSDHSSVPTADLGSEYASVNAISGPTANPGSEYAAVNAISGPSDHSSVPTANPGSEYAAVNAITGPPASEPTLVSGGSGDPADGFEWGSAAIGAGAVLAMGALGSALLLTVRRRTDTAPSMS